MPSVLSRSAEGIFNPTNMDFSSYFYWIPALILAITVHEFMHAYTAFRLGDPTAKHEGRVTLNPLAHLDFLGTIMLFLIGIGWGKPVPVNPSNFRNPQRDSALVSLAGPLTNLASAFLAAIPLKYLPDIDGFFIVKSFLAAFFQISILLFIFNILPFPPLDGSKILGIIVPQRFQGAYEVFLREGMKYLVAALFLDFFIFQRLFRYSFFHEAIWRLYDYVSAIVMLAT